MNNPHKGFAPLVLILIAAGILVVGGAGYWYYKSQTPQLIGGQKDAHGCLGPAGYSWCEVKQKCLRVWEEKCEATSTTQTTNSQTADWKIYTNKDLGFSIEYPNEIKPNTELNDRYNRLTGFGKLQDIYFDVRLIKDDNPDIGVKYGFLEAEIVSKDIKLGGVNGYKAVSKNGYGDVESPSKDSPYVEFAARHNGDVYHLIFWGNANVSAEEQQILSTFKFTR